MIYIVSNSCLQKQYEVKWCGKGERGDSQRKAWALRAIIIASAGTERDIWTQESAIHQNQTPKHASWRAAQHLFDRLRLCGKYYLNASASLQPLCALSSIKLPLMLSSFRASIFRANSCARNSGNFHQRVLAFCCTLPFCGVHHSQDLSYKNLGVWNLVPKAEISEYCVCHVSHFYFDLFTVHRQRLHIYKNKIFST